MLSKHKLIFSLVALLIGVTYLSTVNYFVPESLIYIILPFLLIFNKAGIILNKGISMFFIFVLVLAVDQLFTKNTMIPTFTVIISYSSIFIWAAAAIYFAKSKVDYFKLTKLVLLFSFITVLISSFWTAISPELVRATVSIDNQDLLILYSKLGLMSYGFAHALPLTFPILIFIAKHEKRRNKIILYSAVMICLLLLFQASISTAFFLGLLISTISLFIKVKNLRQFYLTLTLMSFIFMLWGNSITISFLELIQPYSTGTAMESKIHDLLNTIKYGELDGGEVEVRAEKQELSWSTFYDNVLLGSHDKEQTGGHSFAADYLAYFGVIGFLPFILFLFFHLRYFYIKINLKIRPYYIISIFYYIAISFLKASAALEMYSMLLFVLPGLALLASVKLKKIRLKSI